MPKLWPSAFAELERAVDRLFDDILINPWRESAGEGGPQSALVDLDDRYEVHLPTGDIDPERLEVEVTENRLVIRAPGMGGVLREHSFTLAVSVDRDRATARWAARRLAVVMPKRKTRAKS